jgi:alpha-ribazole phosphatase/probable phosphoglycerate mutase
MAAPGTLLFIRHAATALAGAFCGHSNPPLNDVGVRQAAALADRLKELPIDALWTSDLLRARQTAAVLASAHAIPIYTRTGLREIDFGDWETLTWAQIEQRDPAYAARWVSQFPSLPTPNGEPIAAFQQRVRAEIAELRRMPYGCIAIVTHAGVLRVLLEDFGHLAPQHAWERTREYTCVIRCTQRSPDSTLNVSSSQQH